MSPLIDLNWPTAVRPALFITLLLCLTLAVAPSASTATDLGSEELLLASTLLGASAEDALTDMEVAPDGTVYVVGWTESSALPTTPGAFDRSLGGERDAYVARLSADLTTLLAATYLGGASGGGVGTWDAAQGFFLTSDGLYITGYTYTEDFPVTAGAFDVDNVHGGATAFVVKMSLALDSVDFGTYLGESDTDLGYAIARDVSGEVFVTGFTVGPNFPTTDGAYDTVGGPYQDVFVSRLSGDLSTLVASTLVPNGIGTDLAIDAAGSVFVGGYTTSPDFPTTPGAYDRTCGSDGFCDPEPFGIIHSDVFISRLDRALTDLEASTYLGHDRDDEPSSIVLDGEGGLYVSGTSASSDFPTTPGAFQTDSNGFNTVFVSRMDVDLSTLEVSTLLAGFKPFSSTEGHDMTIDETRVYVTGETFADDFPTTPDAFDSQLDGANEVIVSVFDRELGELTFSSMLGGNAGPWPEEDRGRTVALAGDGTIYASGRTISPDFPTTPGSFQEDPAGDFDGFVTWVVPGSGMADLTLNLEPTDPPIVLFPEGGTFAYTLVIRNNSGTPRRLDFWREIVTPTGRTRTFNPRRLTVPAHSTVRRELSQRVSARARAGVYELVGHIGAFPVPEASDSFSFRKSD